MKKIILPPKNEAELLERATQLAGLSLAQIAKTYSYKLPKNLLHAKGFVGQLLEQVLGATAGVKSQPDFEALAVELKSIPIDNNGKPSESTYVCTVPMLSHVGLRWHESVVYKKLAHVLWIPIQSDDNIPIPERKIGMPLLWRLPQAYENTLKQDWEELMEFICLGKVESITAYQGVYLQIRPKAADSRALREAIGKNGEKIKTLPRGFYLRANFTRLILDQHYL
jgi:DNA mismatch repair protein MutH